MYSDLTMVAFVSGYVIVVNCEMNNQIKAQMTQYLEERMEDTNLDGWERASAFHVAWLNILEQGRCTWCDSDQKLHMSRAMVWHAAMANLPSSLTSSAGAGTKAAIKCIQELQHTGQGWRKVVQEFQQWEVQHQ